MKVDIGTPLNRTFFFQNVFPAFKFVLAGASCTELDFAVST